MVLFARRLGKILSRHSRLLGVLDKLDVDGSNVSHDILLALFVSHMDTKDSRWMPLSKELLREREDDLLLVARRHHRGVGELGDGLVGDDRKLHVVVLIFDAVKARNAVDVRVIEALGFGVNSIKVAILPGLGHVELNQGARVMLFGRVMFRAGLARHFDVRRDWAVWSQSLCYLGLVVKCRHFFGSFLIYRKFYFSRWNSLLLLTGLGSFLKADEILRHA